MTRAPIKQRMIDDKTPMSEVLERMKQADSTACYAFCRRQRTDNLPALAEGARLLGRVAHQLQCERPNELMAWKFPEVYEPIPGDALPVALDAAAEGDADRAYTALRDLDFAAITAAASAAAQLAQSADHLMANPHRQLTADPQGVLF